jgi:hypothetical protein
MGFLVSRDQVVKRLRDDGWSFKERAKRTEMYRKPGSTQRLFIPLCNRLSEVQVRVILQQAGLSPDDIADFCKHAVK